MTIRDQINQRPKLATGIAVAITVLALAAVVARLRETSGRPFQPRLLCFYSVDDGQSYFADDLTNLPPFPHDGKLACRAMVYRCGSGKPFVAYLQRFAGDQRADMQRNMTNNPNAGTALALMAYNSAPMEVKRPGEGDWVSSAGPAAKANAKEYRRITTPVCPDGGTGELFLVAPSDPQNGATN